VGGTYKACGWDYHHYGRAITFSKEPKCEFRLTKILYMGHVICVEGVKVHQENIQTILEWPIPRSFTNL
jgi:hypothetical protein